MGVGRLDSPLVGQARHRGRRRQQPDPPGMARDHRQLRRGTKHSDHIDIATAQPQMPLDRVQRRRARGVARDHEQLRAGREQVLGDLDRERLEFALGPVAVREPGGVAQVQVVLAWQRHE